MWQIPQRWDGANSIGFQIFPFLLQIIPSVFTLSQGPQLCLTEIMAT